MTEYDLTAPNGENRRYTFDPSYVTLDYERYKKASDQYWLDHLPSILHFCIFCAYHYNDIEMLSDVGCIHEIVHVMDLLEEPLCTIQRARESFDHDFKRLLTTKWLSTKL